MQSTQTGATTYGIITQHKTEAERLISDKDLKRGERMYKGYPTRKQIRNWYSKDIPIAVIGSVLRYISEEGDDLVTDIRIAEYGNVESERVYEQERSGGCCGFVDYVWVPFDIKGKKYYFGYNYGH